MNATRVRDRLLAVRREVEDLLGEVAAESKALPLPRAMSINQYAKYWNVSQRTIYRWIELGLPIQRRGKIVRVLVLEAEKWDEKTAIRRHGEIAAASGGKTR